MEILNTVDTLTGLNNRRQFDLAMQNITVQDYKEVALIILDVDGLKIINDSLGHQNGDNLLITIATILMQVLPNTCSYRIGGDEFAAILPNHNQADCDELVKKIDALIAEHNTINPSMLINVSIGYAVSTDALLSMEELFKLADDRMYRRKMHSYTSVRSAIVSALIKALEYRDFQTEGHCARVEDMLIMFADAIGIHEYDKSDLRLLAHFHDIGKVSTPDHILFKPGRLTSEEKFIMQQHSEIGCRIANSTPDLQPIADFILKHHEWWNGNGYPLGIKEKEIPLPCRMLAIVDAFDAMTANRPYREGQSIEFAIRELKDNAGTQFDPELVDIFCRHVLPLVHAYVVKQH